MYPKPFPHHGRESVGVPADVVELRIDGQLAGPGDSHIAVHLDRMQSACGTRHETNRAESFPEIFRYRYDEDQP
jgi:hypothetical protein